MARWVVGHPHGFQTCASMGDYPASPYGIFDNLQYVLLNLKGGRGGKFNFDWRRMAISLLFIGIHIIWVADFDIVQCTSAIHSLFATRATTPFWGFSPIAAMTVRSKFLEKETISEDFMRIRGSLLTAPRWVGFLRTQACSSFAILKLFKCEVTCSARVDRPGGHREFLIEETCRSSYCLAWGSFSGNISFLGPLDNTASLSFWKWVAGSLSGCEITLEADPWSLNTWLSWFSNPKSKLVVAFEWKFPGLNVPGDAFCNAFVLAEACSVCEVSVCSWGTGGGKSVASTWEEELWWHSEFGRPDQCDENTVGAARWRNLNVGARQARISSSPRASCTYESNCRWVSSFPCLSPIENWDVGDASLV